VDLEPGYHHVELGIKWPEISPGQYTITFGIGEGEHPMRHVVQCWAHNMLSVSAISPDKCVHAIFNNPINSLVLTRK
jgi:hypothetical protein